LTSEVHWLLSDFDGAGYSWAEFRMREERTYGGYLNDLEQARRTVPHTADEWPLLLCYTLCASSVVGRVTRASPELTRSLYLEGLASAEDCAEAARRLVDHAAAASLFILLVQSALCTENLIRVDDVVKSLKLAE
jgi:hypothetical protein